ncbi:MAG: hypothetical protein ACEY3B_00850, partial [Wolbachia sp.]
MANANPLCHYERCSLGHQWGVIPVPRLLGSRKLNSTPSKCTIRTRFQTGMTPYLTVIPPRYL